MNVFLATPTYNGKVLPQFEQALKASLQVLKEADIPAHWEALSGCCYLPIARNKLVKQFLESDATDMVFIDDDIEWTPDGLVRLLSWPVDIVGAAYRHKTWEETYPVWIKTDHEHRPVTGGLSELIECWGVPTGFMRINRAVFEAMQAHYGLELEIEEYTQDAVPLGTYLNFFDTGRVGRQWWGEDTNFCRRWTMEMKRRLWCDPQIHLTHWGKDIDNSDKPYPGNFHEYLSRLPGGANDPGYHDNKIDGYMTVKELQWLYNAARGMDSIVEVGSHKGRSSHALLSGCNGTVYCVDPWQSSTRTIESEDERYREFCRNTEQFRNRVAIRLPSTEAAKIFADKSVDMVFIDADHYSQAVREDIVAWAPKARKLVCGHDYGMAGWPDVKTVVDALFPGASVTHSIWHVLVGG